MPKTFINKVYLNPGKYFDRRKNKDFGNYIQWRRDKHGQPSIEHLITLAKKEFPEEKLGDLILEYKDDKLILRRFVF